jgi:hypothetical protein
MMVRLRPPKQKPAVRPEDGLKDGLKDEIWAAYGEILVAAPSKGVPAKPLIL